MTLEGSWEPRLPRHCDSTSPRLTVHSAQHSWPLLFGPRRHEQVTGLQVWRDSSLVQRCAACHWSPHDWWYLWHRKVQGSCDLYYESWNNCQDGRSPCHRFKLFSCVFENLPYCVSTLRLGCVWSVPLLLLLLLLLLWSCARCPGLVTRPQCSQTPRCPRPGSSQQWLTPGTGLGDIWAPCPRHHSIGN